MVIHDLYRIFALYLEAVLINSIRQLTKSNKKRI